MKSYKNAPKRGNMLYLLNIQRCTFKLQRQCCSFEDTFLLFVPLGIQIYRDIFFTDSVLVSGIYR